MASLSLQPGEVTVLTCRRHWIYLYPPIALYLLVLIVPIVLLLGLATPFDGSGAVGWIAIVAIVLWAVFWGFRAYFAWYRHRNDLWIITNQRLVDSRRRHWFHHELASADLVDVTDTSVTRNGVLRTALNYGDLMCQTAGQQLNFVLTGIPRPVDVLTTLDHARDEARRDDRRL